MSPSVESTQLTAACNGKAIDPNVGVTHSDGIQAAAAVASPNGHAKISSTLNLLPHEFYQKFLSDASKSRKPSAIRSLFPLEAIPGIISLLVGKPDPSTFPFTSFSFTARSPSDPTQETILSVGGDDLVDSLQYGATSGLPKLLKWIYGLQEYSHGRKREEGWGISMGCGSQDLIYKAVIALVNEGDSVLVESPVYAGVIPMFHNLKCDQIEVNTDAHGISTTSLRSILEGWPSGKPKPKVLYTVPYGCNPTGMTATLERRKEVLRLAREHDFLILEDDPYYYLYYGAAARYPSYFTLEAEEPEAGRVLRFDSLSKVLSAGIRIGFATGPKPILEAIDAYTGISNLQVPSLTQAIVFQLLDSWGYDGFDTHVKGVSEFYRKKRDVFERAMLTHLAGLAEWVTPEAGMFVWFKLLLSDSISAEEGDSESLVRTKAVESGVLALPGTVFFPNGRKTAYVRASFSITSEEDVEEAMKRLRRVILDARSTQISTL